MTARNDRPAARCWDIPYGMRNLNVSQFTWRPLEILRRDGSLEGSPNRKPPPGPVRPEIARKEARYRGQSLAEPGAVSRGVSALRLAQARNAAKVRSLGVPLPGPSERARPGDSGGCSLRTKSSARAGHLEDLAARVSCANGEDRVVGGSGRTAWDDRSATTSPALPASLTADPCTREGPTSPSKSRSVLSLG